MGRADEEHSADKEHPADREHPAGKKHPMEKLAGHWSSGATLRKTSSIT
jgi:hypothetical protein